MNEVETQIESLPAVESAVQATKAKKTNLKLSKGSSKVTDGDLTDALKSIEVACVNFGFPLPNDNVQARADAGIS